MLVAERTSFIAAENPRHTPALDLTQLHYPNLTRVAECEKSIDDVDIVSGDEQLHVELSDEREDLFDHPINVSYSERASELVDEYPSAARSSNQKQDVQRLEEAIA